LKNAVAFEGLKMNAFLTSFNSLQDTVAAALDKPGSGGCPLLGFDSPLDQARGQHLFSHHLNGGISEGLERIQKTLKSFDLDDFNGLKGFQPQQAIGSILANSQSHSAPRCGEKVDSLFGLDLNNALIQFQDFLLEVQPAVAADEVEPMGPFGGWNILQPAYTAPNLLDTLSLEWDYHMVHDSDKDFTGIVAVVIANPRGTFGSDLVPSGANLVVSGQWEDGTNFAEFIPFGLDVELSADERYVLAGDPSSDEPYALLEPIFLEDGTQALAFSGQTETVEFDLTFSQDWTERPGFEPVTGNDIGIFPGEQWTVYPVWPRSLVTGTIENRQSEETFDIDGHGYRENSFGRYGFVFDGWDFGVVSDADSGVQWVWQTYHSSDTLDYLDISFYDNGELQTVRFEDDDLGWRHPRWTFDTVANRCIPLKTVVEAENEDYRVVVHYDIGNNQVPILSDATPLTNAFVIMGHFPMMEGAIYRSDGSLVTTFEGQGGGEISFLRSLTQPTSNFSCFLRNFWQYSQFL
jgi:hypothetical protein